MSRSHSGRYSCRSSRSSAAAQMNPAVVYRSLDTSPWAVGLGLYWMLPASLDLAIWKYRSK